MKKKIFGLSLFISFLSFSQLEIATPASVGFSQKRLNRLSEISQNYIDKYNIPGMIIMISRKGKIVYNEAFGNRGPERNEELKKDDIFRIYSMSKPIAGVAIMQLYEKGKFQLSDPITKFLPEMKNLKLMNDLGKIEDLMTEIKMHNLLTHTAGFSYGFSDNPVDKLYSDLDLFMSKDLNEFGDKVSKLPLRSKPGKQFIYSVAVDLTGLIIERISGKSLDEYYKENIFIPLGMKDTYFKVPKNKLDRFLKRYIRNNETGAIEEYPAIKNMAMSDYINSSMHSAGGGLVSTALDYLKFAECLRNEGLFNGVQVLSPKTVKFMTSNHLESVSELPAKSKSFGFGIGLGIVTNSIENKIIGSDGEYYWQGPSSMFWVDPIEEIVVVSMFNIHRPPFNKRNDIKIATYQALTESYE